MTPEVEDDILDVVNETPESAHEGYQCKWVSLHATVWRVVREQHLYPYHLQRQQAISLQDYPARVMLCQWFLHQCGTNPDFPALAIFTDEAQFTGDGIQNF
jgi:hypothetical protein